jgi:molecular chaperone GrpE
MRLRRESKEETKTELQDVDAPNDEPGTREAGGEGAGEAEVPDETTDGRVAELEKELADWKDRCLRAMADMDNVRRRARIEAEEARKYANENLVADLLPVLDNFSRALDAAGQTSSVEALASGVEQIHRQLSEVLARAGLRRIDAVGQPFDPNLHEAILQVEPQEGQEAHQVVEELRPGYRLNDRVVRPSLVKVTSG